MPCIQNKQLKSSHYFWFQDCFVVLTDGWIGPLAGHLSLQSLHIFTQEGMPGKESTFQMGEK